MKKLLTLIMAGCIALSLAACSPKGAPSSTPGTGNSNSTADNSSSTKDQDKKISTKSNMGKVTSVAGNEIEINLVKEPEMPEAPESQSLKDGEMMESFALTPATEAGAAGGGGAAQRTEIELTGELKSYVIPAGMAVKDAMGNEKQLSDIKKGSLLNVMVDQDGNVTEVYLYE